MRPAASRPSSPTVSPPRNRTVGSPEETSFATSATTEGATRDAGRTGTGPATAAPSSQDTSAGRTRVATCPDAAAATASAASAATSAGDSERRTHPDTVPAIASMSDSSGASSRLCERAWSPTTFTSGVRPRRALCRLASPLPRPGPRCSSVAAGRPAIRAYPSAAPVATPSNRLSTPRISGTSSSAATKCISEVPGLAKQTSTPAPTSVRMSACAPFTGAAPRDPAAGPSRQVGHAGLDLVHVEVDEGGPTGGEVGDVGRGRPALRGGQRLAHSLLRLEVQLGDEVGPRLGGVHRLGVADGEPGHARHLHRQRDVGVAVVLVERPRVLGLSVADHEPVHHLGASPP